MKCAMFLLSVMLSAPAYADSVSDAYLRQLSVLEQDLVPLAMAMPTERFGFRPTYDVRTFREQIKHVATAIYLTAAIVLGEQSPYGPGTNDNGPDAIQTKENTVDYLQSAFEYARRAMKSITEENHLDRLATSQGTRLRIEVAATLLQHGYNHFGQMLIYAQMNGVVLPAGSSAGGEPGLLAR
jgi:hypothetical protein